MEGYTKIRLCCVFHPVFRLHKNKVMVWFCVLLCSISPALPIIIFFVSFFLEKDFGPYSGTHHELESFEKIYKGVTNWFFRLRITYLDQKKKTKYDKTNYYSKFLCIIKNKQTPQFKNKLKSIKNMCCSNLLQMGSRYMIQI